MVKRSRVGQLGMTSLVNVDFSSLPGVLCLCERGQTNSSVLPWSFWWHSIRPEKSHANWPLLLSAFDISRFVKDCPSHDRLYPKWGFSICAWCPVCARWHAIALAFCEDVARLTWQRHLFSVWKTRLSYVLTNDVIPNWQLVINSTLHL